MSRHGTPEDKSVSNDGHQQLSACAHIVPEKHAAELQQSRVLGVVEASGINRILKLSKEQGAAARQDRIKKEGAAARQDRSKEEGPAGRQVVSEEDGTRVQQESNEVPSSQEQSYQTMCWQGIIDMYLRLRSDGFTVNQIHTYQCGELCSEALEKWCSSRTILHTYTPGISANRMGAWTSMDQS